MRGARNVGRFAPTPNGHMHAGNLLCALLSYLSVKSKGGSFAVRIEDLDKTRCPDSDALKTLAVLDALGLKSDTPVVWQSRRTDAYRAAEKKLAERAELYPCFCSRAELHAAEAPRLSDGGVVYAGTCKRLTKEQQARLLETRKPCMRISVPDTTVSFTDGLAGEQKQNLKTECGDFILKRGDGVYAYQLAVVVDDGALGATEIVRGNDLILSSPRQIFLQRLLNLPTPKYYHIPLVCADDGRKLSKSEGDSAERLLDQFPPEFVLGGLACAAGILPFPRAASLAELTELFDWKKVKTSTIFLPKELSTK